MAKRNRYRELESLITKVILGNIAVLVLFFVFSWKALVAMKVITAMITIICALLALAWLFLTGEITKRRSLWMVTGFVCILLLVVVSLLLGFPCPKPV